MNQTNATAPTLLSELREVRNALGFLPATDAAAAGLDRIIQRMAAPTRGRQDARNLQRLAYIVCTANATGNPDLFIVAVQNLLDAVRSFRPSGAMRDALRYRDFRTALTCLDTTWMDRVTKALEDLGLDPDGNVLPTADQVDAAFDIASAAWRLGRTDQ